MSGSAYKLKCPHCRHGIRVRNSVSQHPLLRAAYLQCTNVNCGATYRGQFEITHLMSPSACPNPEIDLPFADTAIRQAAVERENTKQIDIDDILNPPLTQ
ncbi:ogr/Delta-like zinc finger family protein [Marinobacterium sedimentorum]|uniref:ogr/Delta-like zinc finger family protein n=1 Tax=Marinobacterium sedimentorum TaxID=2927804 RepID=UPI0020C6B797|nr:ogr/Delta-like zinc finger family protein [Marinobacterium sedimentorum]MCP8687728.1 ogr/Delta-like zinc finger family protein [Marinobacterium sedimentorum]